jgi:hypothetical protein
MTSNSIHVARTGSRSAVCLEDDLRDLADQFQRCTRGRGRWMPWRARAHRVRAFTASHVVSLAALGIAALALYSMLG